MAEKQEDREKENPVVTIGGQVLRGKDAAEAIQKLKTLMEADARFTHKMTQPIETTPDEPPMPFASQAETTEVPTLQPVSTASTTEGMAAANPIPSTSTIAQAASTPANAAASTTEGMATVGEATAAEGIAAGAAAGGEAAAAGGGMLATAGAGIAAAAPFAMPLLLAGAVYKRLISNQGRVAPGQQDPGATGGVGGAGGGSTGDDQSSGQFAGQMGGHIAKFADKAVSHAEKDDRYMREMAGHMKQLATSGVNVKNPPPIQLAGAVAGG